MFEGLRSLIFQVPDVAEAKAWYEKVLGYAPYFDEAFYVGFNVGGFELGLLPTEGDLQQGDSVHCYWGVPDIQAAYDRLKELGAVPSSEINNVGGPIELATFKDPWGNAFGIIYNPEFQLPV